MANEEDKSADFRSAPASIFTVPKEKKRGRLRVRKNYMNFFMSTSRRTRKYCLTMMLYNRKTRWVIVISIKSELSKKIIKAAEKMPGTFKRRESE